MTIREGASLPREALAVYQGAVQSAAFTAGAVRVISGLADTERSIRDGQERTAAIAAHIADTLSRPIEERNGAIDALAEFFSLYIGGEAPTFEKWRPLQCAVECDTRGREQPSPLSQYFDVGGDPVSVTPDLSACVWRADESHGFSIEVVRALGAPISRRRFDRLRSSS